MHDLVRYTNNFLFNAGLLGFMEVLGTNEFGTNGLYEINGNTLSFSQKSLNGFTEKYFDAMKNRYREGSSYQRLISDFEAFIRKNDECLENKKILENIIRKMTSASYVSGYEIIESNDYNFDITGFISKLKTEKNYEIKKELLKEMLVYVKDNEDVLLLKDISYTKINSFWSSVSFMNPKNSKLDMKKCYDEHFTQSANEYFHEKKNEKNRCIECSEPLGKSKFPLSWLNDYGVDLARKRSHYWEFNVDTYLCPICNLILSCVPLGFNMVGKEGLFINDNSSISRLKNSNNPIALGLFAKTQHEVYGRLIQSLKKIEDEKTVVNEIGNIQVIRRTNSNSDSQKYKFNVFSKNQLKALEGCEKQLSILVNVSPKRGEKFMENVYNIVMDCLTANKSLFSYIADMLSISWSENLRFWFLLDVLIIQSKYFKKEGEMYMSKVLPIETKVFIMSKKAEELKRVVIAMEGNSEENANNKLRGFVYQLLNALKTKDVNRFMDVICRLYIGLGREIPMDFKDVLADEELFQSLGYAFIIGLKGDYTKKPEKENDGQNNGVADSGKLIMEEN